jgi:predicted nucleic acid-binding protein
MALTTQDYLVDTSLFIHYLRGIPVAKTLITQLIELTKRQRIAYSLVTELEIWAGITQKGYHETDYIRLLQPFMPLPITSDLLREAGKHLAHIRSNQLKHESRPSQIDEVIATTALQNGLTLITHNDKHFKPFHVSLYVYIV